jgi:lysophospholipase L1-like esterase
MRVLLVMLGLMAFGGVFGLVVVEGALTVANVAPVEDLRFLPAWANAQHPQYGWFHYPGSEFTYRTRSVDFGTHVRINSKGLREKEYDYRKPPGVYRVLVLGDSFVPSLEVPFEQIWHEVLERRLNEGAGANRRVEVIGAGVQGWSIDQELLYYRHEGHKYEADLVLLQTYLSNDVTEADVRLDEPMRYQKPYFVLADGRLELKNFPYRGEGYWLDSEPGPSLAGRVKKTLRRNSRAYRYVTMTVLGRRGRQGPPLPYGCWRTADFPKMLLLYAADYPPEFEAGWALFSRLVDELRAEVVRHHQRFAVVNFPNRRQVLPVAWKETLECWPQMTRLLWDLDKPDRRLSEQLREQGVDFLAVAASLRKAAAASGRSPYIERDNHFNREGHVLVAHFVYDWLKGSNLIPR